MMNARRRLVLHELDLQCGFALKAYGAAASALKHKEPEVFWYSVEGLLGAAAAIHRFLEDEPEFQAMLDLTGDSALRRPELAAIADMPAAFLRWISSHPKGSLRLSNFGPLGVSHADAAVFARFIDVDRSVAIVFGNEFDLGPLLAAVATVSHNVKAELRALQTLV